MKIEVDIDYIDYESLVDRLVPGKRMAPKRVIDAIVKRIPDKDNLTVKLLNKHSDEILRKVERKIIEEGVDIKIRKIKVKR